MAKRKTLFTTTAKINEIESTIKQLKNEYGANTTIEVLEITGAYFITIFRD